MYLLSVLKEVAMKIYITGSVASGKTTLAEKISSETGIPCYHLDEIVHVKDENSSIGNVRRSDYEIDKIFNDIISKESYVIEDTGRERFLDGMKCADYIIMLDVPYFICKLRIMIRFIKQNLGIEKCAYEPNFTMLRHMYRWARNFQNGNDGVKNRTEQFGDKLIHLHNTKEINDFIKNITGQCT